MESGKAKKGRGKVKPGDRIDRSKRSWLTAIKKNFNDRKKTYDKNHGRDSRFAGRRVRS